MATTIRLTVNEEVEALLVDLKRDYPALSYPEILKLALSDYHRRHKQNVQDEERRRWYEWERSLPELELGECEKDSIAKARRETATVMTVGEIVAEADGG
jgi:hypothetical protein